MKAHYEWGISDDEQTLLCEAPLTFSVRYLACIIYATFIVSLARRRSIMSLETEHQETHLVLEAGEPLNNIFNEVSFLFLTYLAVDLFEVVRKQIY